MLKSLSGGSKHDAADITELHAVTTLKLTLGVHAQIINDRFELN